jgi:hypothetical protein
MFRGVLVSFMPWCRALALCAYDVAAQGVCTGGALTAYLSEWASVYAPLPLWLTEFSCFAANATENLRFLLEVQQQLVVQRAVPALERYAWYATRTFDASGASAPAAHTPYAPSHCNQGPVHTDGAAL